MGMKVGELFAELDLKDNKFSKGLNSAKDALANKLGVSSAAVGAAAAGMAAVGTAAAAAGTKGVKEFAKFESGMREVFTLVPDASEEMKQSMMDDIREFSTEMGVATEKSVPALYQAISAGVPKDNVFNFLETAQKAAVGGVTELETAVDGISSVVNAYGDDVIDATEASDLMFTAVKQGKTTFEEMSSTLYNVIPTASSLGVEFGDITAAIATMTAQGTPTAQATTQIRQALNELSDASSDASAVFKEMSGQSFKKFIQSGGNVQEAFQLLSQYAKENNVSVKDLFGSIEAGQAVMGLTGKSAEKFAKNLKEMEGSAGATDAAYDEMEKSLSRSFEKIKVAVDDVFLAIGEELAPVAVDFAKWIQENMPEIKQIMVTSFKLMKLAIVPVIEIIQEFVSALLWLGDKVAKVVDFFIDPFDTVQEYLGDIDLYDIGRDMIQGLINGIKSLISKPVQMIKNMAGDAMAAAKNILGIRSPSKEFENIGKNVTAGFEEGIKATERSAANRVAKMMDNALPNVQPQMQAAGSGGPKVINLTANYYGIDNDTASNANNDLVSKLQGRGIGGSFR